MRKLLVFVVVIVIVLLIGSAVSRVARSKLTRNENGPVFTSAYTLDTAKSRDLFVVADTAQLLADSHVNGNTSLIGRTSASIDGQINGDLTVMSGDIQMGKTAQISGNASLIGNHITLGGRIDGDLSVVADTLNITPGVQLNGAVDICANHFINEQGIEVSVSKCGSDELAGWQSLRDGTLVGKMVSGGGVSLAGLVFSGLFALGLAALSGLIVTIFPRHFGQMTQAVRNLPARVSRVGCLTQALAAALVGILGLVIAVVPPIGLILVPILALLFLPLVVMFAIGWMTIALLTGDWLVRRFARRTGPPMLTVIAGSLALFLLWTLLGILPFGRIIVLILILVIGAAGLGAVIMTRLGTRSASRSYFVQG